MRRAVLAGLVVAGTVAAAGTARYATRGDRYEVPERTAAVRAEEARLAALVATTQRWAGRPLPECKVRVLGMAGATSYAWADCTVAGEAGTPGGGWSTPYRVDGTTVRGPMDGSGYAPSVRELFPGALAEAILDHRADLRPG